jgi:hypothetical protein
VGEWRREKGRRGRKEEHRGRRVKRRLLQQLGRHHRELVLLLMTLLILLFSCISCFILTSIRQQRDRLVTVAMLRLLLQRAVIIKRSPRAILTDLRVGNMMMTSWDQTD